MEFFNQKKYSFSSSNWISHQFKFLIPGSFWLHGTVSRPVPASSTRMTGASVRTLVSSHWGSYQHWLRSSRKYFYSGFMTLIAPLTIRNQYWHSKMRIRNQKIQPKNSDKTDSFWWKLRWIVISECQLLIPEHSSNKKRLFPSSK